MNLTHKEVIKRLCKLQAEVTMHMEFRFSADCFCKDTIDKYYRNEGKALEFIEQAVREKITKERTEGVRYNIDAVEF